MPRQRGFWVLLVSLVLAGLVASLYGQRPRLAYLALSSDAPVPEPQRAGGRVWKEAFFEKIVSIPAGEGRPLKAPTVLRLDPAGNVFVLDSADRQVEKYSPSGELSSVYGSGEIQNPSDVAVDAGGEVWICDPRPKRLYVFSPDGKVVRRLSFDRMVWRMIQGPTGDLVATVPAQGEPLFQRFSGTGRPGKQFGKLLEEEMQNALTADGWMVPVNVNEFIYLFRHVGLIASYSMDGKFRYLRRTIDPVPLPEVRIDASGGYSVSKDAPLASISGSVVQGELLILTVRKGGERVLDVYDAGTGAYRYSFRPPETDSRYALLTSERFYNASRRGLTIWRRTKSAEPPT
jgi:hypothetical protein